MVAAPQGFALLNELVVGPEDDLLGSLALLNDEPVAGPEGDLLGSGHAARRLADLLIASRASTPFTLSVDAGWGMGKSSLMRLVDAELTKAPEVRTVWYNAWTSTGADALEGLIKSVLMRFDRRVLRRALHRISEQRALLRVLRAATALAAGPLGAAGIVDELWRALSADSQARNEMRDAIRELAVEWAETAEFSPRRLLVVFIDDLDRCSEEAVLAVCEAVKIYLDVPGLAFVIGCDRSVLGPDGLLRDLSAAGFTFLEKIFQTSYRIPVPDEAGVKEYIARCARGAGIERLLDEPLIELLAERSGRNPRRVKRLVNGFVLEATLNPAWHGIGPGAVIRTLLLQYFYADFYRMMAVPAGAGEGDVVAAFMEYRAVRRALRAPYDELTEEGEARVAAFFGEYELARPTREAWAGAQEELERHLPSAFPQLVADSGFTSLIDEWRRLPESAEVARRLREGRSVEPIQPIQPIQPIPPAAAVAGGEPAGVAGETRALAPGLSRLYQASASPPPPPERLPRATGDLSGLRLLWVDDKPDNNRRLIELFRRSGAVVVTAVTSAEADAAIAAARPDALLSDIDRHGNRKEGLEHVARLRADGRYDGPVIFHAGWVTPERMEQAAALDAFLSNNETEVEGFVLVVAAERSRAGVVPPARLPRSAADR